MTNLSMVFLRTGNTQLTCGNEKTIKLGLGPAEEETMIEKLKAQYAKLPPVLQHVITAVIAAVAAYYGVKVS